MAVAVAVGAMSGGGDDGPGGGGGDYSTYSDPSANNWSPSYDDTSGGSQSSDPYATYDTSGDAGYAAGGGVLPQPLPQGNGPTTGGHVPAQASPSMGQNTDDIPARLNADEFVIPRDVAHWKGQEFFQKLIDESRRKRLGAPAKGKPKPPLGGPPRFTSQHMGAQ